MRTRKLGTHKKREPPELPTQRKTAARARLLLSASQKIVLRCRGTTERPGHIGSHHLAPSARPDEKRHQLTGSRGGKQAIASNKNACTWVIQGQDQAKSLREVETQPTKKHEKCSVAPPKRPGPTVGWSCSRPGTAKTRPQWCRKCATVNG